MADIKISELPTATSVNDVDIFVMDQSLVTKTATRAQILASIKDANNNITANAFFSNLSSITASGTPVVLTVASAASYLVTGSGGQTIKLPDATTLPNGTIYRLNNNQSSGAISVNNNSNTLIASIPAGGFTEVSLLDNSTAAGSWERHEQAPSNVSWSTNTFDYPGSITSATWNGNAVAINRGGTGATSAVSALTSLGAQAVLTTAAPLALTLGGTGAITASAARAALGAAASGANTDITSVTLTTGTISTAPSGSNDLVTKSYADSIGSGINFHDAAEYATVAALPTAYTYSNGTSGVGATITANAVGTLAIDGYTLLSTDVGKRLLIKNETGAFTNNTTPSAAFNGVYTLTTAGTASVAYVLTRATDYDTSGSGTNEISAGDFILVLSGSLANTAWVQQTKTSISVGSTSLSFTQFASSGGVTSFVTTLNGLTPSGTPTTGAVSLAGTLGVSSGGTGSTSQAGALTNLGAQAVLTTAAPLALTAGGTGTTSAVGALTNLGAQAALTTAAPLALTLGGTASTSAIGALTSLGASPLSLTLNAQTGTTYTLVLADNGKLITLSNASAIAVTVPTNASVAFPIGSQILLNQLGAGQVTVSGASVTFNGKNGLKTSGQYAVICLIKIATDTWVLSGDATV